MKKFLALAIVAAMLTALCVVASAIHKPEDTTSVWMNLDEFKMSWDTIYINGQSHMDLGWGADGGAPGKLEANQPLNAADIETFTIRGWAGLINGTVAVWGYKINEGAPVFDESFTKPTEQPVIDAGGDSRFEIIVPVGKPSAPTLITAVAKDEAGNVYDFIEFSLNGQYEKAPEQPSGSSTPAGEDQWICGAEPVAEEGQVTTGWWFNPVGEPDDRYLEVNFTAASYFSGVHGFYYCSNPDANPDLGLAYAHMTLQLIKDGAVVAEKEMSPVGDAWYDVDFGKAFGPGDYSLKYSCKSGSGIENNCWCVIGAAVNGTTEQNVTAAGLGNTAGAYPPALMLIGAKASNPGSGDAAIIAIAAVGCIALAGVVIAKKAR